MAPYEMELVELNTGKIMHVVGLGTSVFPHNPDEFEAVFEKALEIGYRHIDTATLYYTEPQIGNVTKRWIDAGKIKREDLFLVTKLPQTGMTPERVSHFLKKSLKNLQTEYVDLYLIHWPIGLEYTDDETMFPRDENGDFKLDLTTDLIAVWKEMEKQMKLGLAKAIGVCNFNESQLQRLLNISDEQISVNQVEMHVFFQQESLRRFCLKNGICVTAYHPLGGRGREHYPPEWNAKFPKLFEDETVIEIAKKYERTPAQLLLRFLIQMGVACIPKSTNPDHLKENFAVTDFNIKLEDMNILRTLDKEEKGRSCFCFIGSEKHPEYPF